MLPPSAFYRSRGAWFAILLLPAALLFAGGCGVQGGSQTGSPSIPIVGPPSAEAARLHLEEKLRELREYGKAIAIPPEEEASSAQPGSQAATFEFTFGDVSSRGTTPANSAGVSLTSTDPGNDGSGLPEWVGDVVTGWVRVNNGTGATMYGVRARVDSVAGGATYDDSGWNYGTIEAGASSGWLPWSFTDADHTFSFVVSVTWLTLSGAPQALWSKQNSAGEWLYASVLSGIDTPVPLTNDPSHTYRYLALSADGSTMALVYNNPQTDVFVGKADGTGTWVNVSNDPGVTEMDVWLSADGSKVAWAGENDATDEVEVYIANTDGSGKTNISNDATNDDFWPSLSANGSVVVWNKFYPSTSGWQVFRWVSGVTTNITNSPAVADLAPVVSASGTRIVWFRFSGADNEVYLWDSGSTTNISNDGLSSDETVTMSADGSLIVWEKYYWATGDYELFKYTTAGGVVNLSNDAAHKDIHPSCSSDGSRVLWLKDLGATESELYASIGGGGPLNTSNDPSGKDIHPTTRGRGYR